MLQTVDVGRRSIDDYQQIAPAAILEELRRVAKDLAGARILALNATPYGGGVSELLRSSVPLLDSLGLVADWKIISGDERFFQVTKSIHNGLQGARQELTESDRETFRRTAERNARALEERYDFVVVHDPQPAAILGLHGKGDATWVWRCHIDTSAPDPEVWAFLRPCLEGYDAAVFTMREFVPPDLPIGRVEIVPPAIDPLSPKNLPLADDTARQVLGWIGVDPDRPLVTQVSRFDPWKDPLGVIAAYRLAREAVPRLQLALVGSMALDDPEGWEVYRQIMQVAEADPAIHVFTNLIGVGNIEVNAFQRLSRVVVQKSIREGFGLVVSEALWKGTPVVAGRAGGIPLQMADGVGGILVDDVEACATALVELVGDADRAREVARAGRARVSEHFLLPRLLLNELALLAELAGSRPGSRAPAGAATLLDPVCGMAVTDEPAAPSTTFEGRRVAFCSQACLARFLDQPERYLRPGPAAR